MFDSESFGFGIILAHVVALTAGVGFAGNWYVRQSYGESLELTMFRGCFTAVALIVAGFMFRKFLRIR